MTSLSRRAFTQIQAMFFEASGIHLSTEKRALVESRLRRRVEALSLSSFDEYCEHLSNDAGQVERQHAVDLLTTNETYFFREPQHFEVLGSVLTTKFKGRPVRLWSAACSTGEEAYSIAMVLLDQRPDGAWELRASDLASRVLERARRAVYPLQRIEHMPPSYLKRFCLRGTGEYDGTFRVAEEVRRGVHFFQHNLLHSTASLGTYEVIFLRNVLIYFSFEHKQKILQQIVDRLRPGGLLFFGTAESLQGHVLPLTRIATSVYEKT